MPFIPAPFTGAIAERGSAPSGITNAGQVVALDVSGRTELNYIDDSGQQVQLTSNGNTNAPAISTTNGLTFTVNNDAAQGTDEDPAVFLTGGDGGTDLVRTLWRQDSSAETVYFSTQRNANGAGYTDIAPVVIIGLPTQTADLDPTLRFSGGTGSVNASVDIVFDGSADVLTFTNAVGYTFDAIVRPSTNDADALGSATVSWADLFLASGAVVNFNNGDVTITHSLNALAFAGGTYNFDGAVGPSANDAAALGSATVSWADLFLASGAVINFNNGDVTITHSLNALAIQGGSVGIGTATPDVLLDIVGDANGAVKIDSNETDVTNKVINIVGTQYTNTNGLWLTIGATADGVNNTVRIGGGYSGYDAATLIRFYAATNLNTDIGTLMCEINTTNFQPGADDGIILGAATRGWSDLYLASGGMIRFNDTDVQIQHTLNTLTFVGGTYNFDNAVGPSTNDAAALGSATVSWADLFLASGAVVNFNNGDVTITHSLNALAFVGGTYNFDGAVGPSANDAAALGSATVSWADLFLASGAVINFNNGDVTITHSLNALAFAGATNPYTFDNTVTVSTTTVTTGIFNVSVVVNAASVATGMFEGNRGVIAANNDEAYLSFRLSNNASSQEEVARITWVITDVTSTSADGRIDFAVMTNDILADELQLDGTALSPSTNDGLALGTTLLGFADLFLASGAVINFNNGDVIITHSLNVLAITGGNVGIGTASPFVDATNQSSPGLTIASNNPGLTLLDTDNINTSWSIASFNTDLKFASVNDDGTGSSTKITFTRTTGNIGIGTSTFGTNAATVLGIANGTVPSTSPADMIQLYSKDSSDGAVNATLAVRTEQAVEAIGTFTASHKLKLWINEVEYWVQLDAVV